MATKVARLRWPSQLTVRSTEVLRVGLPAMALAAMFGLIFSQQPLTMSYFGLTILLDYGIPIIFAALAQMCIIAVSDIDLGIGPFIGLASCIAVTLLHDQPWLGFGSLVLCILAYMAMGALIYVRRLPAIVVTLGASFIWLGCALLLLPSPGGTSPGWLSATLAWHPPLLPLPVLVVILSALGGYVAFMRSSYGAVLRGVGSHPAAVQRAGWSLLAIRITAYGMAGFFGILAGLSLAGLNTSGDATAGAQYTLTSIAAVIVGGGEFFGGIVSPIGAVIGALIMLLTGSLISYVNISTDWQLAFQGGVLIFVLGIRALAGQRS